MYVESFYSRTHSRGLGGLKNGSGGGQSCQNMNRIMKMHHPLSPRIRHFLYTGIILLILSLLFFFICLKVGGIALFETLLSKVGVSLGVRALSFAFLRLGWGSSLGYCICHKGQVANPRLLSGITCSLLGRSREPLPLRYQLLTHGRHRVGDLT